MVGSHSWSSARAWKARRPETVSRVRIPVPPPRHTAPEGGDLAWRRIRKPDPKRSRGGGGVDWLASKREQVTESLSHRHEPSLVHGSATLIIPK